MLHPSMDSGGMYAGVSIVPTSTGKHGKWESIFQGSFNKILKSPGISAPFELNCI